MWLVLYNVKIATYLGDSELLQVPKCFLSLAVFVDLRELLQKADKWQSALTRWTVFSQEHFTLESKLRHIILGYYIADNYGLRPLSCGSILLLHVMGNAKKVINRGRNGIKKAK